MSQDELAEINGIRPKKFLADGEQVEAKSMSSSSVYDIKRTGDHYYCTCPAWRNQAGPTNARTCKHLRSTLGDAYEDARLELKNPGGQSPKKKPSSRVKPASKTNKPTFISNKRKRGDSDDGDNGGSEDKEDYSPKKKRKPVSGRGSKIKSDEEGGQEEEEEGRVDATPGAPFSVLLANSWKVDGNRDITGWWMSEKLDGVRVYYDTKQMMSRLGNPFSPPKEFLAKLPKDYTLDGELFGGRGKFQETVSIVKSANSPLWKNIIFKVFDVPSKGNLPFEERMEILEGLFGENGTYKCPDVQIVEQTRVEDKNHVLKTLKDIESKGGEGVMLREPGSQYEGRRSNTLLKLKSFYDAEAKVIGHEPGSGRHQGATGALRCVMQSGKKFKVGSGLTDKQRKNPPKVGAIIVYRFQELTKDGVPRFPTFVGESIDKTEPKDAEVPEHRKLGVGNGDA